MTDYAALFAHMGAADTAQAFGIAGAAIGSVATVALEFLKVIHP